MTTSAILQMVRGKFPELESLSPPKLKLVEKALKYATELAKMDDLLTDDENKKLLKALTPKGGLNAAQRLKAYRLRQDLSQNELADKTGISQSNIAAMESGKRPIGLNIAKKLAEILNCDYKKLV